MVSVRELLEQEQSQEKQQEPIVANYYDPEAIRDQNRKKEQLSGQIRRSEQYFFHYVLGPLAKLHGSEAQERSNPERERSIIKGCLERLRFEDEKFIIKAASQYENQVLQKHSALLKESGIDKIEFFS